MISNICRANFSGGRTAQGNNRFQWDYGQILEISGIENLPDPFTAQFSNYPVLGTAKTTVGTGGRVEIPNEYFVSGQNIYCFIVLHTDEDDGRTVYVATIPVTKRPKPIDDPITPTQQSTIDTAIAALQAGVARAEGFAGDAEEQATIATGAATTATEAAETATGAVDAVEAAATRAETAADGAEASATAAEASATDAESAKTAALAAKDAAETAAASAEQSATDAGNYAGLAEEAERDAQAAKTAAEASATAAAGSASEASGSASQAAQKASEAASSATAAQTSATNAEAAKTGAETAQEAAETAQGKAEEAAGNAQQSATTAEWYAERVERFLPTDTASGEIASFPDGADGVPMQSVVVSMEPVQDLHGYDSPWPAGGGKNLFDPDTVAVGYINDTTGELRETSAGDSRASDYIAVDGDTSYFFANSSPTGRWGAWYDENKGYISSCNGVGVKTAPSAAKYVRITASHQNNNPDYANNVMVAKSATEIPWSPYENICPISGWNEGTVYVAGVNVWDEEYQLGFYNAHGVFSANTSGYMSSKNMIPVKPNSEYAFCIQGATSQTIYLVQYHKDGSFKNRLGLSMSGGVRTIPIPEDVYFINFSTESFYGTTYNHDISINYPPTDHDYYAYTGDTLSVSWESEAGTVYGGTLDVVSGELVVDRAVVDLGTLNWTNEDSYLQGMARAAVGVADLGAVYSQTPLCSTLKGTSPKSYLLVEMGTVCFSNSPSTPFMRVRSQIFSGLSNAEIKTALTGVQFVYELAAPITYHLTPQEMRTLLGQNNVWSDAGDVTVTYKADVQLYIDKRISALS